jgi:hypothetical protein
MQKIRNSASDMILDVHSDAPCLSAPKAHSRAGGCFFLVSIPRDTEPIFINGTIHITCTILKLVAVSAAKAELGALFLNSQEAKVIRLVLEELGHLNPFTSTTTPLWAYSTTHSRDNGHRQWKCGISGCSTARSKNYSISTTSLVKRT